MEPKGVRERGGVLRLAGAVRDSFASGAELEGLGRGERLLAGVDRLATTASARPTAALGALIALNLLAAAAFVGSGRLVFGDGAEMFRELMPATWLSCAELLLVVGIAWAVHRRVARGEGWRRHDDFWALSAFVFLALAIDEITQATVFVGTWLNQDLGLSPAGGFRDIDAVLLTLLFITCGLVLARRAGALLRHRRALALLAVGVVLGACSQGLDSFVRVTEWEFVAEETLKLSAEPFLVAGYLVVLHDVLRRRRTGPIPPTGQARRGEALAEAAGEP